MAEITLDTMPTTMAGNLPLAKYGMMTLLVMRWMEAPEMVGRTMTWNRRSSLGQIAEWQEGPGREVLEALAWRTVRCVTAHDRC